LLHRLPVASKRVDRMAQWAFGTPFWGMPYKPLCDMLYRMKITVDIHDTVIAGLKSEAERRGCTISELVEPALRLLLRSPRTRKRNELRDLPTFNSEGRLVDIADRDALYDAMDGR
jgi:hypothetical protein